MPIKKKYELQQKDNIVFAFFFNTLGHLNIGYNNKKNKLTNGTKLKILNKLH